MLLIQIIPPENLFLNMGFYLLLKIAGFMDMLSATEHFIKSEYFNLIENQAFFPV